MSRVTLVVNGHGTPSETFQRSLALELAAAGHEVTVHALRAGSDEHRPSPPLVASEALAPIGRPVALARGLAHLPPGVVATMAKRARARFGVGRRGRLAAALAAPIARTHPDVIHVGFSGIGIALADALDLLEDVPLVVSCRGTDELVRPLLEPERAPQLARLFERATVVHAVAGAVAAAAVDLGADRARIEVIHPAVDLASWPQRAAEPPGPPWRLVAVARLVPAKGVVDLVSALAALVAEGVDARLRIIGDGPQREDLVLRIDRAGLGERVELLGTCSPEQVRTEVADAHVFVSASLSEGINNGVLEAMALGVPVISTDVGGMSEVFESMPGALVPPSRPDRLAAAVARLVADAPERASRAAAGRARVAEAFGSEHQAARWRAVYDGLRAGPGGSSNAARS